MTGISRRTLLVAGSAGAASLAFGTGAAHADRLEEILASKKLRVGIDTANPPFAMLDAQMQPTGSDIETAQALAADWGVELEIIPTVLATRIPNLQTDRADLIISSLSITPDRAKAIDFSIPYSVNLAVVGAVKSEEIHGMDDLRGKTVALTRAGVPDKNMTDLAKEYDLTIQRYEDDATLVTAGMTGQAKIVATSAALINEIVKRNDNFEPKFNQEIYELAVGIKKGEAALKEKVDEWVRANLESGFLNDLYKKYHGADLPPQILNHA